MEPGELNLPLGSNFSCKFTYKVDLWVNIPVVKRHISVQICVFLVRKRASRSVFALILRSEWPPKALKGHPKAQTGLFTYVISGVCQLHT